MKKSMKKSKIILLVFLIIIILIWLIIKFMKHRSKNVQPSTDTEPPPIEPPPIEPPPIEPPPPPPPPESPPSLNPGEARSINAYNVVPTTNLYVRTGWWVDSVYSESTPSDQRGSLEGSYQVQINSLINVIIYTVGNVDDPRIGSIQFFFQDETSTPIFGEHRDIPEKRTMIINSQKGIANFWSQSNQIFFNEVN
jgi:hypothetical protein